MKYIIMCGGDYPRWETPRHLIDINGEPIVARTIRLLRDNGIEDIAISSNNSAFESFGVPVLKHDNYYYCLAYNYTDGLWCNAFYPTDEPTCYLFGDVVYSPDAIKTIINTDTNDVAFFGSAPPFSRWYPKEWEEPFAFKVVNIQHFRDAIADVKRLYAEGRFKREPIAWELWNVISRGADSDVNHVDFASYNVINDYTCDIDKPNEARLVSLMVVCHG